MALDFPLSPTNGQTYTSGGRSWTWSSITSSWNSKNIYLTTKLITSNYTSVSGDTLACNTITTGAFTVTLPSAPIANAKVIIYDAGASSASEGFFTNNLTVARNGNTIQGLSEDVILNIKGIALSFEYVGGTWTVRNNGDLINFTGANTVTNRFINASTTAANYDVIGVDTTSAPVSITLPATPTVPSIVTIYDAGYTTVLNGFATNNCTVFRNGSTINNAASDMILATKGTSVIFEYNGTTWRMRNGG